MKHLKVSTLIAPSHWASYLVNHDASGLDRAERAAVELWVKAEGLGWPVSCDDYGFTAWHDATRYQAGAADCQAYTFLA